MKTRTAVLILLIMSLSLSASAFDGKRKGFVIGGGIGGSPVTRWSTDYLDMEETAAALGFSGFLGYSWDNSNMIVLDRSFASYSSDEFTSSRTMPNLHSIRWYHYFGKEGSTVFTCLGVGRMHLFNNDLDIGDPKLGYVLGGGYEPVRHVQLGAYFIGGRSHSDGHKFNHAILQFLVTVTAY